MPCKSHQDINKLKEEKKRDIAGRCLQYEKIKEKDTTEFL
jgi:hypothetical protein